jgi:hypothetical protein
VQANIPSETSPSVRALRTLSVAAAASGRETVLLSQDIRAILADWDFDPDQFQARVITGADGTEKIQMRIDLGLMQMEINGRPDGQRPKGFESLLDWQESRASEARMGGDPFSLNSDDCALLMHEGLQYYYRYRAAFHLGRFDLVARDTARNLRLFAFVARHAARQHDKMEFEQYRPYVEMMHTRALAQQALLQGEYKTALTRIDEGIQAIRRFLLEYHQEEEANCSELRALLDWRLQVERERPRGPVEQLEHQLELSVELENYEEAARIRDQIRRLQ